MESSQMKKSRIIWLASVIALVIITTTGAFAGWSTVLVDDGGDDIVGHYTSLEVVNNQPAISYNDDTNDNLKYVRAVDAIGEDWGTPVLLDTANVRSESDLLVVDGFPAVAYFDSTQKHLKFIRAKDANGTSWNTPETVDDSGNADWMLGAGIVAGNPAICYLDNNNYNLMYVRATNAQGTAWDTPMVVDDSVDTGYDCSIAIVNGNPAISYWEYIGKDADYVKFVRALDSEGATWGTPDIIEDAGGMIYLSEMRVVNGNPAVAYHDSINNRLLFTRATNNQGSAWGTPVKLDDSGIDVGLFSSLAIIDGKPAISYVVNNSGNPQLRYVTAVDASGSSWNEPTIVGVDHTGWWNSLADFKGQAAISSFDSPNTALRFAFFNPEIDHTLHLPIIITK